MPARREPKFDETVTYLDAMRDATIGGNGLRFEEEPALDDRGLTEWRRLAEVFASTPTRFREGDRAALIAYCTFWGAFVAAAADIADNGIMVPGRSEKDAERFVKNPAMQLQRDASVQLRYWARELGLTPDARGRMGIRDDAADDADEGNPFSGGAS